MVQLGAFVVPSAEDPEATVAEIVRAEALGLDLVGVQDHPYQRRFLDTFALLAFAAARTSRIRLFPDVANLPLRQPAVLAKAAASIDRLSGGRFELGLGAGAFWDAIVARGGPRRSGPESVDALVEAITVIRRWWAGSRGGFTGEHYTLAGANPGPPPAHEIGIWLGAYGPRMLRVTGELADGWVPSLPRLPREEVAPMRARLDAAAERAGRDPAAIAGIANVSGTITDGGPPAAWLTGPVEHWVEELGALASEHRFSGFVLWSDGGPEQLERFAAEVGPGLRAALGA
jgi:alkanesulfonate monooxygenase SsuD/methylene tetrahydromethanopterin reductase-like flavin-dependent oxidoreductase (luciferase family)